MLHIVFSSNPIQCPPPSQNCHKTKGALIWFLWDSLILVGRGRQLSSAPNYSLFWPTASKKSCYLFLFVPFWFCLGHTHGASGGGHFQQCREPSRVGALLAKLDLQPFQWFFPLPLATFNRQHLRLKRKPTSDQNLQEVNRTTAAKLILTIKPCSFQNHLNGKTGKFHHLEHPDPLSSRPKGQNNSWGVFTRPTQTKRLEEARLREVPCTRKLSSEPRNQLSQGRSTEIRGRRS